ncbi:hypothetical protein R1sor_023930 [Riccia sorocarpa]|uniref:Arc-like DNA binding domain-containing protein n=1 Tax=Riccia sorocarpa TaxID=122646 RepID=A0ABD3GUZ3_9MARC
MTRPPRPKYPSDSKNYHEQRRPGFTQTIRLPEDLLETFTSLKGSLGSRKSNADVIRFLFEAAEPAITSMIEAESSRLLPDLLHSHVLDEDIHLIETETCPHLKQLAFNPTKSSPCELQVSLMAVSRILGSFVRPMYPKKRATALRTGTHTFLSRKWSSRDGQGATLHDLPSETPGHPECAGPRPFIHAYWGFKHIKHNM